MDSALNDESRLNEALYFATSLMQICYPHPSKIIANKAACIAQVKPMHLDTNEGSGGFAYKELDPNIHRDDEKGTGPQFIVKTSL